MKKLMILMAFFIGATSFGQVEINSPSGFKKVQTDSIVAKNDSIVRIEGRPFIKSGEGYTTEKVAANGTDRLPVGANSLDLTYTYTDTLQLGVSSLASVVAGWDNSDKNGGANGVFGWHHKLDSSYYNIVGGSWSELYDSWNNIVMNGGGVVSEHDGTYKVTYLDRVFNSLFIGRQQKALGNSVRYSSDILAVGDNNIFLDSRILARGAHIFIHEGQNTVFGGGITINYGLQDEHDYYEGTTAINNLLNGHVIDLDTSSYVTASGKYLKLRKIQASTVLGDNIVSEDNKFSLTAGQSLYNNSSFTTLIGKANDTLTYYGDGLGNDPRNVLFAIGNGELQNIGGSDSWEEVGTGFYGFKQYNGTGAKIVPTTRSNALEVTQGGKITAPSLDISEITEPKDLITKEYADANYSGGGGSYTDEQAQDAIGTILSNDFTYDDATPTISLNDITQSKVTGLVDSLGGKVSKSGDVMTGDLTIEKSSPQFNIINSDIGGEYFYIQTGMAGSTFKFSNTGFFGFGGVASLTDNQHINGLKIEGNGKVLFGNSVNTATEKVDVAEGNIRVRSMAGTGNRVVTANSTGVLSATETIPTNNTQLTNGANYITDYTVTQADVTQHQAALQLTESQITDLNHTTTLNELTDVIPAGTGEDGYVLTYKEAENEYAFTSIAESESTWQTVALDATNTTAGTLQVKKMGTDLILIGDFTSVSLLADGSDVFTLPVNYRPDYPRRINLYSVEGKSEAFVNIGIDGVGSIYFFDGNSGGAAAANYFVDAEFRTLINLNTQQ